MPIQAGQCGTHRPFGTGRLPGTCPLRWNRAGQRLSRSNRVRPVGARSKIGGPCSWRTDGHSPTSAGRNRNTRCGRASKHTTAIAEGVWGHWLPSAITDINSIGWSGWNVAQIRRTSALGPHLNTACRLGARPLRITAPTGRILPQETLRVRATAGLSPPLSSVSGSSLGKQRDRVRVDSSEYGARSLTGNRDHRSCLALSRRRAAGRPSASPKRPASAGIGGQTANRVRRRGPTTLSSRRRGKGLRPA